MMTMIMIVSLSASASASASGASASRERERERAREWVMSEWCAHGARRVHTAAVCFCEASGLESKPTIKAASKGAI